MGSLGSKEMGITSGRRGDWASIPVGERLSPPKTLAADRRNQTHRLARAGLGANVADAGAVEVGPGLLLAGEAGLHVEAIALAGGLGDVGARRGRNRTQ